jgi:hypothetical protein
MNHDDDKDLREMLKQAIAPVTATELRRDLWPQMLQRLDQRQQQTMRVSWFDWALAALAAAALLLFPGAIPALLYHL